LHQALHQQDGGLFYLLTLIHSMKDPADFQEGDFLMGLCPDGLREFEK